MASLPCSSLGRLLGKSASATIWLAASRRAIIPLCWMLAAVIINWRLAVGQDPATGTTQLDDSVSARAAPGWSDPLAGESDRGKNALAAERPRLLADPFEQPRQLLRLLDIGTSDLNSFVDGRSISATDEEALLKILFRMPQIGLDDIARWLQQPVPWEALRENPSARRGEFFLLEGRVRNIVRQPLRPRLAGLFEFDHYYQVHIQVSRGAVSRGAVSRGAVSYGVRHVAVCCRTIPDAWQGLQNLDQRCRVTGMFLKLGEPGNDGDESLAPLLFAAPRIGWLPDRVDAALGVGPDQVLLGNLGMDMGLFDAVRSRNKMPIGAAERECFYALLSAAGRSTAPALARRAAPLELAALLQHPERAHGCLLSFRGTVQRITRVMVDERDIRQQYNIDHYFQLDVLVPLDDAAIEVRSENDSEAGPVYRDCFPFTCCSVSLPKQWEQYVGREKVSLGVIINGFFFKMWAYPNPFVATFDERQRQLSPMTVLHDPVPVAMATGSSPARGLLIGLGFLVFLLVIWGIVWILNRTDRKHAEAIMQHRFGPDQQPDFQHLEDPDV